jgi:hypothetical protein
MHDAGLILIGYIVGTGSAGRVAAFRSALAINLALITRAGRAPDPRFARTFCEVDILILVGAQLDHR